MAAGARGADRFLWVIIAVAAAAVLAVAVSRGRSRQGSPQKGAAAAVSLPRLDGNGRASIAKGLGSKNEALPSRTGYNIAESARRP